MGDINAAKADGEAFVTDARAANRQITTSTNLTGTIPGYTGQRLPEEALADDPDRLTSQGASGALGNDAWRLVTNPDRTTVTLDRDGLLRAQAVQEDPDAYLAGSSLGAANAQCQPLPPSGAGTEYYEATCEQGAQPIDEPRPAGHPGRWFAVLGIQLLFRRAAARPCWYLCLYRERASGRWMYAHRSREDWVFLSPVGL
jgi:conjugal transfer mating pair stabilization protein TraN